MRALPILTSRDEIRAILEHDRPWAAYALGDLEPHLFGQCRWFGLTRGDTAVLLVFLAGSCPTLIPIGRPSPVARLLEEIRDSDDLERIEVHVRPEIRPLLEQMYEVEKGVWMTRMILGPHGFTGLRDPRVTPLDMDDLDDLLRLYEGQQSEGGTPPLFSPEMLERGIYFGIREAGRLVAAAGTHIVAPREGVVIIGNVYTHPNWRSRGFGKAVTAAVVCRALEDAVQTVALNVAEDNTPGIRVYKSLGFEGYCRYFEGIMRRR